MRESGVMREGGSKREGDKTEGGDEIGGVVGRGESVPPRSVKLRPRGPQSAGDWVDTKKELLIFQRAHKVHP